jgi:protein-S-isoprenylcysteine O-methyltransferase Ste14
VSAVEFTRWFLALFFVGVGTFYATRILTVSHRWQTSPVYSGRPGTLHFATHTTFRVFRAVILIVCVARLIWPGLDPFLLPFTGLWHPVVLMLGNGLLLAGFAAVLGIHFFMGKAWRSGTSGDETTELVTSGPFAVSRNPMMLCVIAAQAGLFLALPSVFTLVCLVAGVWAVIAQVGVEEQLLRRRFGSQYDAYAVRTPRWL